MGNILMISDVHINDYLNRCPSYRYRLYQSRIVAQNVIKVAKAEGADTLFIAGDLIHKSVMRPYILTEVKLFLDTLMGYFKTGRIIYGNHDLDSKLPNQDPSDCVLSIMLPSNMKYMDRKIEKFGKSTIAFSNWRQNKIDLDFIPGHVDFLVTHATIAYNPGDYYQSTVLDESKFDMCFSGDIHRPDRAGKYVSIGIPQRCGISDSKDCTGVILDPNQKLWKHVNLNPDDNLLKFEYIKDQRLEGYHPANNTWYVYKPDKSIIPGASQGTTQLWAEVDGLINSVITKENLQALHAEVVRRVPADHIDLDLNFCLTGFRCKNWRSIESLDMKIAPGDRIILHGRNGSGKSSILSAIKYALIEAPRGLKAFVCNKSGDPDCWAEVDFLYQGHQYTLKRGTGTDRSGKCWGLWVDGVQQAYQNVTSFNQDVAKRFPFLRVLEYFYFDDSHTRFLGDMKNEEKPVLIANLLKLEKIDVYNSIAQEILGEIKKATEAYSFKKVDLQGRLVKLETQKASLRVPEKSIEILQKEQAEGYELQKKANKFLEYQMKISERSGRLEALNSESIRVTQELQAMGSPAVILQDIDSVTNELSEATGMEANMVNQRDLLRLLQSQLDQVNTEGSKIYTEWVSLKPDTCPTCGQPISTETFAKYKSSLESRMTELKESQSTLMSQISSIKYDQGAFDTVRKRIKDLTNSLTDLKSDYQRVLDLQDRKTKADLEITEIKKETGITEIPEKVIMPADSLQIMSRIEQDLAAWERISDIDKEIAQINLELATVNSELSKTSGAIAQLEKYIEVTSPVGEIYTSVLTRVASEFSDNHVYYEASKFTFRKKDHLDLISYYINPDGSKVLYEAASSGQKTMMDLHIMSKLTEGLGLIIFDEFLKSLDPSNHDVMLNMIKDMNVGAILLVSHQEGISGFQNKTMELELDQSTGMTKVQFL